MRAAVDQAARQTSRQERGRLQNNRVTDPTLTRYRAAVSSFVNWLGTFGMHPATEQEELEGQVCDFLEALWEQGAARNKAGDVLSGVGFVLGRHRLNRGWELLKVWDRLEPSKRAAPLPEDTLLSMVWVAWCWGRPDISLLLVAGFAMFLRTMEMLTLERWQLQLDAERQRIVVLLPHTKTGTRTGVPENVVLEDKTAYRAVVTLLGVCGPSAKLLRSSCADVRRCFNELLAFHGLEGRGFAPYSLRRGGATAHWRRYGQLDRTSELGRWRSHRTARICLTEAAQCLQEMSLSPRHRSSSILFM